MDTTRSRVQTRASAWAVKSGATALDDEEKRRGRLLLLGKGAVLAHRFDRPLAAESDEFMACSATPVAYLRRGI